MIPAPCHRLRFTNNEPNNNINWHYYKGQQSGYFPSLGHIVNSVFISPGYPIRHWYRALR
ncbi:Protein of unknown function [Pyronema omphalodes CBS 100304]|uniref:Uncharacterized protein n=1 Tax=Pyronema omphalodes (strain CBS 100304) TaxID=1076935 RepID=U4LUH0_PYROM|nr:Protein of unknown function [Pyronema omphalodes CBS 100304]